ncbi:MAG: hypothetical protein FGM37_05060 [Phycisphaerales bacterium]|nr:hypothetical protein [Phycisphaerales bacterium]
MAAPQGTPPRKAQVSWWERTKSARAPLPGSRRVYRSDATRAQVQAVAEEIAAGVDDATALLGPLRPRSQDPLHGLVFVLRDDFLDTLRVHFAVNGAAPGHAFASPIGRGIACVIEDVPPQEVSRALRVAAVDEACAVAMGAELAPWLVAGAADAVARRAGVPLGSAPMAAGQAAVDAVRDATGRTSAAVIAREVLGRSVGEYAAQASVREGIQHEFAASLVRFVASLDRSDGGTRIQRLARALNDGTEPLTAAADIIGLRTERDCSAFGDAWQRFAAQERADARQTAFERLAFLAEGLRVVRADGEEPEDFPALARSLADRNFTWPRVARPGWSVVKASVPESFAVPGGVWPPAPAQEGARVAPGPRFVLERAPGERSSVATEGLDGGDMRIEWLATRPDTEAPLVWQIVRREGPPQPPRRPQAPPP